MEKISLPTRTVSKRYAVVLSVTIIVTVLMVLWMADVVYLDTARRYYIRDFRTIVLTQRNIEKREEGERVQTRTLFVEGGFSVQMRPLALKACEKVDTWDPEMPYLYARALWREYVSKGFGPELTESGLIRRELRPRILLWLQRAIARDPTNRFYRATLAGVLTHLGKDDPGRGREIVSLLQIFPPKNAYGQMRTAERLVARDDKLFAEHALARYGRAMQLVSADLQSKMRLTQRKWVLDPGPKLQNLDLGPLAEYLVTRVVDGILRLRSIQDYRTWAGIIGDQPETHWLMANRLAALRDEAVAEAEALRRRPGYATQQRAAALKAKQFDDAAQSEYQRVVDLVKEKLAAQDKVSRKQYLYELLWPLGNPDHASRFLFSSEMGYAAKVLDRRARDLVSLAARQTALGKAERDAGNAARAKVFLDGAGQNAAQAQKLFEEEADLYRIQIRHRPREIRPRLDLATLLIEQGESFFEEADEQLSAVFYLEPMHPEALTLRGRIVKAMSEE